MVKYDPSIIQRFAEDLYGRASLIVFFSTVIYCAASAAGGYYLFSALGALIFGVVGAMVGYLLGSQRAFVLRLQAQTAMCQVQIEVNTRPSAPVEALDAFSSDASARTAKAQGAPVDMEPKGECPNCSAILSLSSSECPRCKALFSEGSAWKIRPLNGAGA